MSEDYTSNRSFQQNRGNAVPVGSQITGGMKSVQDGPVGIPEKFDFPSGASSSDDLPPYECLTRLFLERAANRMRLGMHYGKHNWKKGTRDKDFILNRLNHAFAHLTKAMEEIDSDRTMRDDDLAAVVVNCMFAMEYQSEMLSLKTPSQTNAVRYENETNQRLSETAMPRGYRDARERLDPRD